MRSSYKFTLSRNWKAELMINFVLLEKELTFIAIQFIILNNLFL